MKTLIVHPSDQSTDFLTPIEEQFDKKTVVRGQLRKQDLLNMVSSHERFIGLGHGSSLGLMSVGQFVDTGFYAVDSTFAEFLKLKANNILIWCFAYEFAKTNKIPCFASDMFVSERSEIHYLQGIDVTLSEISESNECFVREISQYIHYPLHELYRSIKNGAYAELATRNPVAAYNYARLYLVEC